MYILKKHNLTVGFERDSEAHSKECVCGGGYWVILKDLFKLPGCPSMLVSPDFLPELLYAPLLLLYPHAFLMNGIVWYQSITGWSASPIFKIPAELICSFLSLPFGVITCWMDKCSVLFTCSPGKIMEEAPFPDYPQWLSFSVVCSVQTTGIRWRVGMKRFFLWGMVAVIFIIPSLTSDEDAVTCL